MATRFYLPSTGVAPASPAYDAAWESTTAAERLPTYTTAQLTALATKKRTDSSNSNEDHLRLQYVSEPLAAQTIAAGQTLEFQMRCAEESGSNNLFLTLGIRVVSGDGATVRGTVLAVTRDATEMNIDDDLDGTVGGGGVNDIEWINRRLTGTSSAVVCSAGDRLVFEIGAGGTPTSGGHDFLLVIGDNGGADLPEDDTDTTDKNPWIEFPNDVTFASGGAGNAPRSSYYAHAGMR